MLHLSSLLVISSDIVVLFVLVFLLISQLKTEGGELRGGTEGLKKRGFRKGIKYGFCLFLLVCIFFVIHIFSFIFSSEWDQSDPEWNCQIARLNVNLLHQNLQSLCPTSQRPNWRVEAANEKRQQQNRSAAHHHLTERQIGKRSRCQSVIQVKYLIFHDRMNVTR